jgi:hypothetical protein
MSATINGTSAGLLILSVMGVDCHFDNILSRWTERFIASLRRLMGDDGQTETAAQAFADWIAVEPNAVSYGYRAAFHERHEHYPEALADVDKAMADDPDFWLLYHTQAAFFTLRNATRTRSGRKRAPSHSIRRPGFHIGCAGPVPPNARTKRNHCRG